MAIEGDPSYSMGIPLKQAHEVRRDKIIIELQEKVRRLIRELQQIKGCVPIGWQIHRHQEFIISLIDIAYSSSHKDYGDEDRGVRRRRHLRDDLRNFKTEALEFDGNLNLEHYLDWVRSIGASLGLRNIMMRTLSNWSFSR